MPRFFLLLFFDKERYLVLVVGDTIEVRHVVIIQQTPGRLAFFWCGCAGVGVVRGCPSHDNKAKSFTATKLWVCWCMYWHRAFGSTWTASFGLYLKYCNLDDRDCHTCISRYQSNKGGFFKKLVLHVTYSVTYSEYIIYMRLT